jgi:FtsZ-binding cell division protein ZapB
VLSNEEIQRAAIKSAVKAWSSLQGGVEELKERFQDAEAELRMSEQERGD